MKNLLLLILSIVTVVAAESRWEWVNPSPQGNHITAITKSDSLFVTVGYFGSVMSSKDGTNWSVCEEATDRVLKDVAYGDNAFVAVGLSGTILRSEDGFSWEPIASNTQLTLYSVTYAKEKFVIVGDKGLVLTSPDGKSWTKQEKISETYLFSVDFVNGHFAAVGGAGVTAFSDDGETWTQRISNPNPHHLIYSITYGNGTYVAAGYTHSYLSALVLTSTDGVEWVEQTSPTNSFIHSVQFDGSNFYGVCSGGRVIKSPDAVTWSVNYGVTKSTMNDLIIDNGLLYLVGNDGVIISGDGTDSWTIISTGIGTRLSAITSHATTTVAVGGDDYCYTIVTIQDGEVVLNATFPHPRALLDITYGQGKFIAVGTRGLIATSADGISWERQVSVTRDDLGTITFVNEKFIAAGSNGTVLISDNGTDWEDISIETTEYLNAVKYLNGQYVLVGAGELIATSTDGREWTTRNVGELARLTDVTYGNGKYYAVGYQGLILSSDDAVIWDRDTLEVPTQLNFITFENDQFVIGGNNGYLGRFKTPSNITTVNASTDMALYDHIVLEDRSYLVGGFGVFLTSQEGATSVAQFQQKSDANMSLTVSENKLSFAVETAIGQQFTASLYSVTGRKIAATTGVIQKSVSLPLNGIAKGVYIFELKAAQGVAHRQMITVR